MGSWSVWCVVLVCVGCQCASGWRASDSGVGVLVVPGLSGVTVNCHCHAQNPAPPFPFPLTFTTKTDAGATATATLTLTLAFLLPFSFFPFLLAGNGDDRR